MTSLEVTITFTVAPAGTLTSSGSKSSSDPSSVPTVISTTSPPAAAELGPVHDFYREVFKEEGWIVADIGIYQGEWTFFVVSGEREANVELEARQSLVEIEIELSEPLEESGVEPWSG